MFLSSVHCLQGLPVYPGAIQRAVEFLKDTDFSALCAGEYPLEGQRLFYQVKDLVTAPWTDIPPEAHRRYIDVHFVVSGRELIGYAPDTGRHVVDRDLLVEQDIRFYAEVAGEHLLTLEEGDYAVFFPWDLHRPGGCVEKPEAIRKVVVKLDMELLREGGGEV